MKTRVRLDSLLLTIALYCLFISQIYSYVGTKVQLMAESTFGYEQLARTNYVTATLSIVALACVIFLFAVKSDCIRFLGSYTYSIIVLMIAIAAWTVLTFVDSGIQDLLYASSPPYLYLVVLFIVVGLDEHCFHLFLKHIRLIGLCSLVLCIYYFFSFRMGSSGLVGRLGNSPFRIYCVQSFWLLMITSFYGERTARRHRRTLLIIIAFALMNVVNSGRSWLLQCVLWALGYEFFYSGKAGIIRMVKSLIIIGSMTLLLYLILKTQFPQLLKNIGEKFLTDTRSQQYIDLFEQTNWIDFITGKGYFFTYQSRLQHGEYAYIDNGFLLVFIRYGITVGLPYVLSLTHPIVRLTRKQGFQKEIVPLILWIFALGGLSTYCAVIVDIKSLSMAAIGGRCLYLSLQGRRGSKQLLKNGGIAFR